MGAALEEHPVQQVQGLSSSKQKRAVSKVGTTFGKVGGDGKKERKKKEDGRGKTRTSFPSPLSVFFNFCKLTTISPLYSIILSSSI